MNRPDNILPWPVDYERYPRFVRPIDYRRAARACHEPRENVDLYDSAEFLRLDQLYPAPFAERLVDWFRAQAMRIGIALYVLAVAVGCYFAFQLGRGSLL